MSTEYLIMDLAGISLRAMIWASAHVLAAIRVSPCRSVRSIYSQPFLTGFKKSVYLFGCFGSWLRHVERSLGAWAHSSRGMQAQGLSGLGLGGPQPVGSQFPEQGSDSCPLHCTVGSQPLDHEGSPRLFWLLVFESSSYIFSTYSQVWFAIFLPLYSLPLHSLKMLFWKENLSFW